MSERGEREAEIGKRLLRVPRELAYAPRCMYAIVNDRVEDAAAKLYEIVSAELRGERSTCCDDLLDYRYTYTARIVPVYGDQALRCASHPDEPQAQFSDGELPHQAALRALRRELKVAVEDDALIFGDKPDGDYLPPISLRYTQNGAGGHITYIYHYRLDIRMNAPEGWSWVELAEDFASTLLERRGEA
jgi:hypothetical protein